MTVNEDEKMQHAQFFKTYKKTHEATSAKKQSSFSWCCPLYKPAKEPAFGDAKLVSWDMVTSILNSKENEDLSDANNIKQALIELDFIDGNLHPTTTCPSSLKNYLIVPEIQKKPPLKI